MGTTLMVLMVLIDADAICHGRDRTGRTGQLLSHHMEIFELPFRCRVFNIFAGDVAQEKNRLDIGVSIGCITQKDATSGIRRGSGNAAGRSVGVMLCF